MIAKIRLKDFKRFRDLSLDTAKLTVLTGANGAGKTSILQSILLARQMARQPQRSHVELNGVDSLELGAAEDVIHREADDELATIEIIDTEGESWRWSFRAPTNERALNATIVDKASDYKGAIAEAPPRFTYLCAERLGPRDVLGASAVDVGELGVGPRGEFVAQVLASPDRSRVREDRWAPDSTGTTLPGLLHQTERWMAKIVRPTEIDAEWFQNTSVTRLRFKTPGALTEWTRAPNAGFGVSYALPVIVAALRAEVGGLLLVENPEAHLHPAGQSAIGAFLAQVAADGVQIFVETHSDHVLNGIRVAVAQGTAALSQEEAVVHFFRGEDQEGAAVESLSLRRTGQLTDWPAGFFDQTQIDLAALAAKRRRESARRRRES